jgi:hypothetical protein
VIAKRRLHARAGALLLVCSGVFACSGEPSSTNPAPLRPCLDEPVKGPLVEGAVAIGFGGPDNFVPYDEGGAQTLVFGPQGGYMLTPTVRVDASLVNTDGHCPYLDLGGTVDGQEPMQLHFHVPDAPLNGGFWYWEQLPLFLSRDLPSLVGRPCVVTGGFDDDGVGASAVVNVLLAH